MRAAIFLALPLLAGCVERKMIIRSEPAGAEVRVDGTVVGKTPCEVPFTWYGTRKIELERSGYESLTAKQEVFPPWWQMPVFDLFTDVLIPVDFEDTRTYDYTMEPSPAREDPTPILDRAEKLKRELESRP